MVSAYAETCAGPRATTPSSVERQSAIHSFAGGIAMMTLKQGTVADPKIRLLSIDSVPATIAALNDGSYKIRRPLYLVYPVAAAGMKPDVKLFLDFVRSSEGQRILGGF